MPANGAIDRLGMRSRPPGSPVMHQRWEDLLFLHWPVAPSLLRPLIPDPLEIDTFDGQAWIGITPFHLSDLHPIGLPGFPGLTSFHELNVRTYVVHHGVPGIWFFSLDASKLVPAAAARLLFMLPYYKAQIRFTRKAQNFAYYLQRIGGPAAQFSATWRNGVPLRDPDVKSLAFFLVERYCCFALGGGNVHQIRIYHHPWILEEAQVTVRRSTMIESLGIPEPATLPLAHFSQPLDVEVWPPVPVGSAVSRPVAA